MSTSPTRTDDPHDVSRDACQKQQKQRPAVPHIEVVNEIQIVVSKKDNQRSLNVTTPSDSKDLKKCVSSRSSKTDLTAVTTPTTAPLDATTKSVTIKNGRRASREKEKSESICVCGKILKRFKGLLERKEKAAEGESI